jgi:hypothetical protein
MQRHRAQESNTAGDQWPLLDEHMSLAELLGGNLERWNLAASMNVEAALKMLSRSASNWPS